MKKTKAQIDIQFNWIFILIVGGIILSFFVGVAIWYKDTQEQKIAADVVTKLDSLFMTAKESPKTARYTPIPKVDLTFMCSANDCNSYGCASSFSGGNIAKETDTEIIFALDNIKGTNLITWALEWTLPYKIANFLYITNDATRYVLVYDTDHTSVADSVSALLSENSYLVKEKMHIDDFFLENRNDNFVRIVGFVEKGRISESVVADILGQNEWDIIYVDGTAEQGTVIFPDGDVPYTGIELLLGAIFSADADFYRCNIQKAAYQAGFVSAVYAERTRTLHDYFTNEDTEHAYCAYYFGEDVQHAIENVADEIALGELSYEDVTLLKQNNAYAVIKSCPRVY